MKLIFTLFSFFLLPVLHAQRPRSNNFGLSAGVDVAFPEKSLSPTHGRGLGGTIKTEYSFAEHVSVTMSAAYMGIGGKERLVNGTTVKSAALQMLGFKPGLRYYVGNFYLTSEAGIGFFFNGRNDKAFIWDIGVGDKIRIGDGSIDVSLRHEKWKLPDFKPGMIVLRLAYDFVY